MLVPFLPFLSFVLCFGMLAVHSIEKGKKSDTKVPRRNHLRRLQGRSQRCLSHTLCLRAPTKSRIHMTDSKQIETTLHPNMLLTRLPGAVPYPCLAIFAVYKQVVWIVWSVSVWPRSLQWGKQTYYRPAKGQLIH